MCLGGKVFPQFFGILYGIALGVVVEIGIDILLLEPLLNLCCPLPQLLVRVRGVRPACAAVESYIRKGGGHLFRSWITRGDGDTQGKAMNAQDLVTLFLKPTFVSELKGVSLFGQFIMD